MQQPTSSIAPPRSCTSCEPRRLFVFGATGATGRLIVNDALERGHEVTALSRDPARLELDHPRLRKIAGDVLNAHAVRRALAGHDAVLCALGRPLGDRSRLRTRGTAIIVEAMKARGISRLICLSVLGLGESFDNLPWSYRWFVLPLILRHPVADHRSQERVIRGSDLDWTIVRPPNLRDVPATGRLRHGFSGAAGAVSMEVSRADVAAFMLDQLGSERYSRAHVAITSA